MNNEMNFEHLANGTFPVTEEFTAGYEKPIWKMNVTEVKGELKTILQEGLIHGLSKDQKERQEKLLVRQKELE